MTHVIIRDGVIVRSSDAPFVDKDYGASTPVEYDVVWQNGKLYQAGKEPDNTTEVLTSTLILKRDSRLIATDKYMLADYPISADDLAAVTAYRAALRALPEQAGAPWDGGGINTPWPVKPSFVE